jgi:hypothetical protein
MDRDSLLIDVTKRLATIDRFVNDVTASATSRAQFIQDPVGSLISFGILPGYPPGEIGPTNRLLYSLVSNKQLLQFFTDSMPTPKRDALLSELKKANADPLGGYSVIVKYGFNSYLHSEPELRTLMTIALETASQQGVVGVPQAVADRQVLVDLIVRQMLGASYASHLPNFPLSFRSSEESGADLHKRRGAEYADATSGTAAHAGADSSAVFAGFAVPVLLLVVLFVIVWAAPVAALSEEEMEHLVENLVEDYNADPEAFRSATAIIKLISFASDAASFVAGIQAGRQLSTGG